MFTKRIVQLAGMIAVVVLFAVAAFMTRAQWLPGPRHADSGSESSENTSAETARKKVILTDDAIKNLKLTVEPLKAQTFWKKIQVPGMVVDRPGVSDRTIVSPVTGTVSSINFLPGDSVNVDDSLFKIKLLSESLHLTQSDLFKVSQDIKLAEAERKRLENNSSAFPSANFVAVDEKLTRLHVAAKAYRQELLSRGLSKNHIDNVAEGTFVSDMLVTVPPAGGKKGAAPLPFEMQELKVELGQLVQAGQALAIIANHETLTIEGRAFPDETPLLQRSVKESWPIEVDFLEDKAAGWPTVNQEFRIQHLANVIDPVNRTFAFLLPLENQAQVLKLNKRTQMLWRFRPGQRVRLTVPVEKMDNVFVLPADAVARDGPEAFVFTQNVNTFERRPVHLLLKDRQLVVLANDGSLVPGSFVVQTAAAQLNRMLRVESNAVPKGYHMHADGSLHKNEDEGK